MSLTYDLTAVVDRHDIQTDKAWPVTEAVIFLTIGVGIGDLSEANAPEFYARVQLMETIYGAMVRLPGPDGSEPPVDRFLTPADIRRLIGLRTNVGKVESRTSFLKRHVGNRLNDEVRRYTRDAAKAAEAVAV